MRSDHPARKRICIGYTFMFKGLHSTITRIYPWGFKYKTSENDRCWMDYEYFSTIPHYKSKFKFDFLK